MQNLYDLIIADKERIKVKLSSDERVWFVRVVQSRTAKRYNKGVNYSVERVKSLLEDMDKRTLEINEEVLDMIKQRDTRHVRTLLDTLESYNLIKSGV